MITKKILITGGSGLIGKELIKLLLQKNYEVAVLSRNDIKISGVKTFIWDYKKQIIDEEAIKFADIIIHLVGENISQKRWSKKQKSKIIESRTETTKLIFETAKKLNKKFDAFISSSAIGIYGAITSEKIFTENDIPANDFLGKTVFLWEKEVDKFEKISDKIVKLRLGVVLTKKGGALLKLLKITKLGISSPIGSGKQYMPWIALDDLCNLFLFSVENQNISGTLNAVNPEFITNKTFTKTLSKKLNRKIIFPNIPAFILKLVFGEMANILLTGSRISAEKILQTGFKFKNNNFEMFLENELK